jgi:hypothetical protein
MVRRKADGANTRAPSSAPARDSASAQPRLAGSRLGCRTALAATWMVAGGQHAGSVVAGKTGRRGRAGGDGRSVQPMRVSIGSATGCRGSSFTLRGAVSRLGRRRRALVLQYKRARSANDGGVTAAAPRALVPSRSRAPRALRRSCVDRRRLRRSAARERAGSVPAPRRPVA